MKTEDEIQREKDAVQKMIGAKGAMETALQRIQRLETALKGIASILDDAANKLGDGLYIKTHYHGTNNSGEQSVLLKEQLKRASEISRKVS